MKASLYAWALTGILSGLATALPHDKINDRAAKPSVTFSQGTVVGNMLAGVENYAGIPFAEPPTGALRLKPPVKKKESLGDNFNAAGIGPGCPQMFFSTEGNLVQELLGSLTSSPLFGTVTGQTEDCLTMRVQRPEGTTADDKLPVLFWIFGGGFELGSPQMYDATPLLNKAKSLGRPFVFASVNYRVGGFGFMPGKEILADGSANLGLLDQRMGLEWVADNIAAFGGDPDKVTIWGESAGSISVFDQMAAYGGDINYNGKPLFRGAMMNSGSIAPTEPVDCGHCQGVYDQVVRTAGCEGEEDTLECLRAADYDTFLKAANSVPGILSYSTVALSYVPRPDGSFMLDSPNVIVDKGTYAPVPMIIGDVEDEGTLFGIFTPNITTNEDIVDYLSTYFFKQAPREKIEELTDTYDPSWRAGSPFRTGFLNVPYPKFKQISAMLGDLVFTLARRNFLEGTSARNPDVPSWSYLASYNYGLPFLGTFHGSDILQVFYTVWDNHAANAFANYYTSFIYHLDPNQGVEDTEEFQHWPQWSENQTLNWIFDGHSEYLQDDFRAETGQFIQDNMDILVI